MSMSCSNEGQSADIVPDLQKQFKQALFWTNLVLVSTEHTGQALHLLSVIGLRPNKHTFMVPLLPEDSGAFRASSAISELRQ